MQSYDKPPLIPFARPCSSSPPTLLPLPLRLPPQPIPLSSKPLINSLYHSYSTHSHLPLPIPFCLTLLNFLSPAGRRPELRRSSPACHRMRARNNVDIPMQDAAAQTLPVRVPREHYISAAVRPQAGGVLFPSCRPGEGPRCTQRRSVALGSMTSCAVLFCNSLLPPLIPPGGRPWGSGPSNICTALTLPFTISSPRVPWLVPAMAIPTKTPRVPGDAE